MITQKMIVWVFLFIVTNSHHLLNNNSESCHIFAIHFKHTETLFFFPPENVLDSLLLNNNSLDMEFQVGVFFDANTVNVCLHSLLSWFLKTSLVHLGINFLVYITFFFFWASWIYESLSSITFGKVSTIVTINNSLISSPHSAPSSIFVSRILYLL